jgi:hypothetical protein
VDFPDWGSDMFNGGWVLYLPSGCLNFGRTGLEKASVCSDDESAIWAQFSMAEADKGLSEAKYHLQYYLRGIDVVYFVILLRNSCSMSWAALSEPRAQEGDRIESRISSVIERIAR